MTNPSRCVLYARKSTDREDKQILSIPAQLGELREFAVRQGLQVSEELTESYSAREPGRPIFSKLLEDVKAGRIGKILCWKLDRLARNPVDGGELTHCLGKGLLQEIVTPEGTYTGTGDSKFMLSVFFGAATKMTDDLSLLVKRGNKRTHEEGRITGRPPIGYMKHRDRPGFRGAGKVVPDPERFPIVQRVWKEITHGGNSVAEIWRRATQEWGLTTRPLRERPPSPPTLAHFYQLLDNRFYVGEIVRLGVVYRGEHVAMITPDEFEQVQRLIRHPHASRPSRHSFTYAGLMHCGDCGRLLTGENAKNSQGRYYTYYRCGRRREGYPQCHAPAPSEAQVTADIGAHIVKVHLGENLTRWSLEWIDWWAEQQRSEVESGARAIAAEIVRLEVRKKRLTELVISGTLAEQEFSEHQAEVVRRIDALRQDLANPLAALDDWRQAVKRTITVGSTIHAAFAAGSPEERRGLLTEMYENILVKDRKAAPVLREPFRVLDAQCPDRLIGDGGDENYPVISNIALNQSKNAHPGSLRERAFHAWCTMQNPPHNGGFYYMAEREGFEPKYRW